ncbi:MAG: energy-coupling factor transporter transmembrane component T [Propioniciclava sp.]
MSATLPSEPVTIIGRLNPVTRLVALVTLVVVVFALPRWWVAALVLAVVVLPAAALAGTGPSLARIGARILLPIVVVLTLVQGLTFPGGRTTLASWGPLTLTSEGLLFALDVGSRIVCVVLASILLVLTTHPGELMTALTQKGMSPRFSYIVSATLHLIPAFRDRATSILLAQQARGLVVPRNPLRRLGTMMPLIAPLVLGMFTDAAERGTAMEARRFGSPARRTILEPVPDSTAQRIARWCLVAVAAAAVVVPVLVEAL